MTGKRMRMNRLGRATLLTVAVIGVAVLLARPTPVAAAPADRVILPFPPTPSASIAAPTLQESTHQRRVEKSHLPADAPNILVILLDDVGFGLADTYGGPVHTPTLSRIAGDGVATTHFTPPRSARPRALPC